MANRNFITEAEVPELTGNAEADLLALQQYLYKLVSQLGYQLGQLEQEIRQLRGKK